jgi:hypothetical protein
MLWNIRLARGNFLVRSGQIFVGNELVLFAIDVHAICPTIRTQRDTACAVNQYAPCTRLVGTPFTKFSMLSIN